MVEYFLDYKAIDFDDSLKRFMEMAIKSIYGGYKKKEISRKKI
jgi:hypothetical protein